jgi:hypothetical protein
LANGDSKKARRREPAVPLFALQQPARISASFRADAEHPACDKQPVACDHQAASCDRHRVTNDPRLDNLLLHIREIARRLQTPGTNWQDTELSTNGAAGDIPLAPKHPPLGRAGLKAKK